jgi:TRAP-type C4-dicarboxylate transport system permease small subunit
MAAAQCPASGRPKGERYMERKKGFFYWMNLIEDIFLGVGFAFIIVIAFLQVIMRVVVNNSLSWSEELVRYVYIWLCWVGVSLAERRNEHIQLTFITDMFPQKVQKVINICVSLILVVLSCWLIYQGLMLVFTLRETGAASVALKIPMHLVYLSMPVGMLLFGIRVVVKLIHQLRDFGKAEA